MSEQKVTPDQIKQAIEGLNLDDEAKAKLMGMTHGQMPAAGEKTFACRSCRDMFPRSEYSGKQFKLKGKRKCNECVAVKKAQEDTAAMDFGGSKAKSILSKVNGGSADVVKHALAADIKKSQESFKTDSDVKLDDKYQVLLDWLQEGGAKFPLLLLKFYTLDYRGVHAKQRLDRNQEILRVPLSHIMTTDKAKACAIGLRMAAAIARGENCVGSSHSWLASMLLQEKHDPNSYWKPYIDTLPQHYRNMPIFFDDKELHELKGSFTMDMIKNRRTSLKMEYDQIVKSVPEYKQFNALEFMWARLAVITRIFGFEVGGNKTDGLVPMADMLNHKRPNESMWTFEDHKGAFTITTTKRILKGGQIFDSYGRKCNSRYFVNYGFALDENEDNQVNLMFQLFPEDEDSLYHQKLALVRGRARRFFQIPFDHLERVQHQCFSYLRIKHADAKELTEIQGNEDNQPQRLNVQFVSPNNEVNVLADIAFAAECVLAGFDTSLEEDDRLLVEEDKSLTMNVRNCIIMRRGEKQICHAYINLYRIMREYDEKSNCGDSWSTCTYKQFRKSVNDHIKGKGKEPSVAWRVEKYVREVWQPHFTGEKLEINISSNAHEGD